MQTHVGQVSSSSSGKNRSRSSRDTESKTQFFSEEALHGLRRRQIRRIFHSTATNLTTHRYCFSTQNHLKCQDPVANCPKTIACKASWRPSFEWVDFSSREDGMRRRLQRWAGFAERSKSPRDEQSKTTFIEFRPRRPGSQQFTGGVAAGSVGVWFSQIKYQGDCFLPRCNHG